MSNARFVQFFDVWSFLEATKQTDDYSVKNSGALSLGDYLSTPLDPTKVFYLAILQENTVL